MRRSSLILSMCDKYEASRSGYLLPPGISLVVSMPFQETVWQFPIKAQIVLCWDYSGKPLACFGHMETHCSLFPFSALS